MRVRLVRAGAGGMVTGPGTGKAGAGRAGADIGVDRGWGEHGGGVKFRHIGHSYRHCEMDS